MLTDAATRTPFTQRANLIMLTTYPRESAVITDLNFRIYSASGMILLESTPVDSTHFVGSTQWILSGRFYSVDFTRVDT